MNFQESIAIEWSMPPIEVLFLHPSTEGSKTEFPRCQPQRQEFCFAVASVGHDSPQSGNFLLSFLSMDAKTKGYYTRNMRGGRSNAAAFRTAVCAQPRFKSEDKNGDGVVWRRVAVFVLHHSQRSIFLCIRACTIFCITKKIANTKQICAFVSVRFGLGSSEGFRS